jgi:hypothetical protein
VEIFGEQFSVSEAVYLDGYSLVNLIERRNLEYCQYNAQGSGCLTWCLGLIHALAAEGYIGINSPDMMYRLVAGWKLNSENYWIAREPGAHFIRFNG